MNLHPIILLSQFFFTLLCANETQIAFDIKMKEKRWTRSNELIIVQCWGEKEQISPLKAFSVGNKLIENSVCGVY